MMVNKEQEYSFVEQYQVIYETLIDISVKSYSIDNVEEVLSTIDELANFAWRFHPGRFVDTRLEYWAAKVGHEIWDKNKKNINIPSEEISKRRVLHVASETYEVGGHTRLILNMIKGDEESIHSLVVTRQGIEDVPNWLRSAVTDTGGSLISLLPGSYAERVWQLQQLICYQAKKIFYHIHPDDSIPVAALAALPRPQVLTVNHADHVFWLGSALSDIVICIRKWSMDFSLNQRDAQKVMLLPIPLNFAPVVPEAKKIAREKLGIKTDKIILLTVASFYKFIPAGKHNYFRLLNRILNQNTNTYLKIIGISPENELNKIGFISHERIELLGVIKDPIIYYQAADIYIDVMPFTSFTSLYEAMYFGCFPVINFDVVDKLRIDQDPALSGLVVHGRDENEEISFIQRAVDEIDYRKTIATKGQESIKNNYMGEGWKNYLKNIYENSSCELINLRNLSIDLDKDNVINKDDYDAAILSNSFYELDQYYIVHFISKRINMISIKQIIKVFLLIKNNKEKIRQNMSIRQVSWLIRMKLGMA